jgi:hypothetical protein
MNYCSLKDAWSNNDYISKQFKEYMNPYSLDKNIEKFTNEENGITREERICTNIDCNDIINHIKKCKRCYKKIKHLMKPNSLFNLDDLINDNKDTIIIVLIGISIILFFNLINNITK